MAHPSQRNPQATRCGRVERRAGRLQRLGRQGRLSWPQTVAGGLLLGCLALQGCSGGLDWRLTRLPGWGLEAALPCRPAQHQRTVTVAGVQTVLHMAVCSVEQHTFAVTRADLSEPGQVDVVLRGLAQAAQANLQGQVQQDSPAQVAGMTPQAGARHLLLAGRRADGQAVQMAVWVFARGQRVYQATVVGPRVGDADWAPLVESLKLTAP